MTNNILRNRLIREYAEEIKAKPKSERTAKEDAVADHIFTTTEPVLSTMANIHWFDDEHRLAGATTIEGLDVVMLWRDTGMDLIITDGLTYSREMLIPNGRKYELREVGTAKPDVSRTRELVEDLARDHNLHTLTDHKLAHMMNDVLDALTTEQPEHPTTLVTEADYANAPVGTIVDINGTVFVRDKAVWRRTGEIYPYTPEGMTSFDEGKVTRWGKKK